MTNILGNSLQTWLQAWLILIGMLVAFQVVKSLLLVRFKAWAKKTATEADNLIVKLLVSIRFYFYLTLSTWLASQALSLGDKTKQGLQVAVIVAVVLQAVSLVQLAIDFAARKIIKQEKDKAPINLLKTAAVILVWIIGALVLLGNLGVDVTSLVAGLGIGGVAVALAVQNVLGDLLSSFSIYFDKPFEVGDFIQVGDYRGTVKKIGVKSTRIQSLSGEEIVVPNKDLTSSRISNYKKMKTRRVSLTLGVAYETPLKKLREIPSLVEKIFIDLELARLNRVHLKELGASALNYGIVYTVQSSDYEDYAQVEEELHLGLLEKFELAGISLPYPTQRVVVVKSDELAPTD